MSKEIGFDIKSIMEQNKNLKMQINYKRKEKSELEMFKKISKDDINTESERVFNKLKVVETEYFEMMREKLKLEKEIKQIYDFELSPARGLNMLKDKSIPLPKEFI